MRLDRPNIGGKQRLIERNFQGYNYHFGKECDSEEGINVQYLVCAMHNSGCLARGVLRNGIFSPTPKSRGHNHPPPVTPVRSEQFLKQLKEALLHQVRSGRVIYNSVRENFMNDHEAITYAEVQGRLNAWARQRSFPEVHGYHEIQEVLESQEWMSLLLHNHGRMFMNSITVGQEQAAILGFPQFTRQLDELMKSYTFIIMYNSD